MSTEITMDDGSTIETNLPAEKVEDLQAKPEPAAEPAKPEAQPASQTEDEPAKAKAEPEAPKTEEPKVESSKKEKPKPIATLLQKKHDLEIELENERKARAELEDKLKTADSPADIKSLAEKYELKPEFVEELVNLARAGIKPELPKEVSDLIAKQKAQAEQEAEETAFKADVGRLGNTLKDELLKDSKVQDKLKELAYSEEKAPDGEPYFKKPLYELYMNYVKPEMEPGRASAEATRGGSKAGGKVADFAQINADPALLSEFARTASKEQFAKFHAWQLENEKEPLKKPGF